MKIKVYIDGSNLYRGLLNSGLPPKIDIPGLSKFLARNDSLIGTNYYSSPVDQTIMPDEAKAQQRFFNLLKSTSGINLKLGRLEKRWTDSGILYYVEKGVDVMIAKDLIVDAIEDQYEKAYLVSGDGDFAEIASYIVSRGKTVIAVSSPKGFAYHLKQKASGYLTLDYSLVGHLFLK